jgi:hypothetical protein
MPLNTSGTCKNKGTSRQTECGDHGCGDCRSVVSESKVNPNLQVKSVDQVRPSKYAKRIVP